MRCVSLSLLGLLAGCAHYVTEVGSPLPPRPAELRAGESTLGDVLRAVGPPLHLSLTPGGLVMLYEQNQIREYQIGFSVPYSYWKYFKLVYAWARLKHSARVIVFDSRGILRGLGDEQWDKPFGSRFALEFLFQTKSLVDQSELKRPAPEHEWGRALLGPLPVTLNSAQSLTDGRYGLEQLLAPEVVGQHSLEMGSDPTKRRRQRREGR